MVIFHRVLPSYSTWCSGYCSLLVLMLVFTSVLCSADVSETSGETDAEELLDRDDNDDPNDIRDVVDQFLQIVDDMERNKDNCTPGVEFGLGTGVVQEQYGVRRFKEQALLAVNRANFMTRLWKDPRTAPLLTEYFLYTQVRSMVDGNPDVFGAGNCYDFQEYKGYYLFCPYAYRLTNDSSQIMVKDLSVEYKYLGNGSEFFYSARLKAAKKLQNYNVTVGMYALSSDFQF